mgnify:CR=1 FL=1
MFFKNLKKMKTKNYLLSIVATIVVAIVIVLCSCGCHDSDRLIGSFQVINKKSNPYFVTVCSQRNDTTIFCVSEEEYLNIKVGDVYLVMRDKDSTLSLNKKIERNNIVGYSTIVSKEIKNGVLMCKVVTCGGDVVSARIARDIFYIVSVGDSVILKQNRDKKKPYYYVE